MTNRQISLIIGVATAAAIAAVLIYTWQSSVTEHTPVQLPPLPKSGLPPAPKQKGVSIVVPDAAAMQRFVSSNIEKTGIPVRVISVELVPSTNTNAAQKIEDVLSNAAVPIIRGRSFRGVVSLSRRCNPGEPCGSQVLAPSQLDWTEADRTEFQNRMRGVLQDELNPKIRDDDLLFRVSWRTESGEQFTTYLVASKENTPRFESMLFFSTVEKGCSERTASTGPGETALDWDGEVRNGFGLSVVTWKGHVTYRYQNGRLLTPDLCPNKTCLTWSTKTLWQVDDDATTVTTSPIKNAQPDETTLAYRVTWSVWFPKVNYGTVNIEMPAPKGNVIAGSFSIRGDGTWNKNN